jgi:hypothetical protein
MPLFLDIYFIYRCRYNTEVEEEKIDTYNISVLGLLVVLSASCGLEPWMQWNCIDVNILGFKSVEELYPSSPLGGDSLDTIGNCPRGRICMNNFNTSK